MPAMDTERLDQVVLHVDDRGAGDGATLVFANSLGTDLRIWDPLMAHLPPAWRQIRYDKRGHGLTAAPATPWTIDDLVDDLARLLDARGTGPAIVVGLSVGGLIAIGLAAARPDLVRGLVLADTAAKIGSDEIWNPRIEAVETGGMAAVADATMERWFSAEFRADPARLAPWRMMLTRTDPAGYVTTSRAIRDTDYRARASALAVPAIAVVGEEDGATPPALVRETAGMIAGCEFHEIRQAGHIPCVEQPAVLGRLISAFVARLA